MNNKFKRALSLVLAFVMLLSCMTVVNVSSVWAAVAPKGYDYLWSVVDKGTVISVSAGGEGSISRQVKFADGTIVNGGTDGVDIVKVTEQGTFSVTLSNTINTPGTLKIYGIIKTSDNYTAIVSTQSKGAKVSEINNKIYSGYYSEGNVSPVEVAVDGAGTFDFTLDNTTKGSGIAYVTFTANGGGTTDPTLTTEYEWVLGATAVELGLKGTLTLKAASDGKSAELSYTGEDYTLNDAYKSLTPSNTGVEKSSVAEGTVTTITYTVTPVIEWFTKVGGTVDPTPTGDNLVVDKYEANNTTFDKTNKTSTIPGVSGVVLDNTDTDHIRLKTNCGFDVTPAVSGTLIFNVQTSDNKGVVVTQNSTTINNNKTDSDKTGIYEFTVEAGKVYTVRGGNSSASRLTSFELRESGTPTPATYTVTVNVKDGTTAVTGATVTLTTSDSQTLTAVESNGVYTVSVAAGTVISAVNVAATGYKTYSDTTSRTINANTAIDVALEKEAVVTKPDTTVTIYDNVTKEKVTSQVYFWTTKNVDGERVREYKNNNGAVINISNIINGTDIPGGADAKVIDPKTDLQTALTNGMIYVTAENYVGLPVDLTAVKDGGNVNVLLTPLADVNIQQAGKYSASASDIVAALLTGDALYSYQNPYIKHAQVNGFSFETNGSAQLFKVMQKVNTRNQLDDTADRNHVQASGGCTIKYTPAAGGKLTVRAQSGNKDETGRGYTLDKVTSGDVTLTGNTIDERTFDLTANTEYTLTVKGGSVNIKTLSFVPDEITKYSVNLNVTNENLGTTSVTVGGASLVSGNSYDEYSEVIVNAAPTGNNKVAVVVNDVPVSLTDNSYKFVLTKDTTIDVKYAAEEIVVTDKLEALQVGDKVDFTAQTLTKQNETYAVDSNKQNKAKYYADAITGGGKTSVIKLQHDNQADYIQVKVDKAGTLALLFNGNDVKVTDSNGKEYILSRNEAGPNKDVVRTIDITEEMLKAGGGTITLTITACNTNDSANGANVGNAYVSAVAYRDITVLSGKNVVTIYGTENVTNTDILTGYGVNETPEKAIRIIGQLNGITDVNANTIGDVGFVIIDTDFTTWKTNNFAEANKLAEIKVSTVYPDLYSSSDFDSSKVTESGTYTGTAMGLSQLNTYFDTLVYGDAADFTNARAYTFTVVDGQPYYYNNQAELAELKLN